jgi:small subunit ribosomal protein S5
MAENETKNSPKDMVEAVPEELEKMEKKIENLEKTEKPERRLTFAERRELREVEAQKRALESWIPKTKLGLLVKAGKIKDIDKVLDEHKKILESEIVDTLLNLESDVLLIGQAKGKFGGGKRRAWRQTQKKTKEGNVLTFSCMVVVGDKSGHVGIGYGRAKETLPAKAKALRKAKLNLIRINRGFESPESEGNEPHTVPYTVTGKCGSVKLKLIPATRGTGLAVADECKKILRLAGIKDVYGVSRGQTRTTFNLAKACIEALKKTKSLKL